MRELLDRIEEAKWSASVDTKWSPPEGLFTKDASMIANTIAKASDDLLSAMGKLNFYINRAGKNLSSEDKKRLESAKNKLIKFFRG